MTMPWDQWWREIIAIAAKNNDTVGEPALWMKYNYERGQTPQEAYDAEYASFSDSLPRDRQPLD